jgi:hypothetical protein
VGALLAGAHTLAVAALSSVWGRILQVLVL